MIISRRRVISFAGPLIAGIVLAASGAQSTGFMSAAEVRPGMVGIGRTVFAGDTLEEFKANIIGVLHNVIGPGRDLILAKLEGGPLANTGVIQGMSGSPVFINGRLIGAVSYSLGSFSREPIAGITPIAEMTKDVDFGGPRQNGNGLALSWPATQAEVFATLRRLAQRASAPLGGGFRDLDVRGPAALADLAPALRPIGTALTLNGFEPSIGEQLRDALGGRIDGGQAPTRLARPGAATASLRPGDAVGVSLVHGDLESGATGTVTWVDGTKVYAFGHPFLNLGPMTLPMTHSFVYTVLPSLDSSLKIASLGPVVGTVSQDRTSAIGGTLGAGPKELEAKVTLSSDRAPDRTFTFYVPHDPLLTPLFGYVSVINALASYERQTGPLSIAATGTVSFGRDGQISIDEFFAGDNAMGAAASAATASIGPAATNEFRPVMAESLDVHFRITEQAVSSTIERVWLDTTKPRFGETHTLQVLLRDYRGASRTITIPVTMPAQASGPLTLLVSDADTLTSLENRELRPGRPTDVAGLMRQLSSARHSNRVYVRLLSATGGTTVGGETLPALPASVRAVLDTDKSTSPVSRSVVGSWEQRLDRMVRGSRELTITLTPSR